MRARVRWLPLAAFLVILLILDATRGLAGPVSRAAAFFLPALLAVSFLHLVASWLALGYHQNFSTDHPAKGETVAYGVSVRNGLPVPQTALSCRFAGREGADTQTWRLYLAGGENRERESKIVCAYRGVYTIGLEAFSLRDSLGLLEIEFPVEPRKFYVYPELVILGSGLRRLAAGGGEGRSAPGGGEDDPGVFEGLKPLADGRGSRRIAWKRWAASGVPCEIADGKTSAYGLRVVLDLRPPDADGDDRLACEDLAVGVAYSVIRNLTAAAVPTELVLGGEETGSQVDDMEHFDRLFAASTSVLFTDRRFPVAAFGGSRAVLLVSTRSLAEAGREDLFSEAEAAVRRGLSLSLCLVPPPARADAEKNRALIAAERLGGSLPIQVLDPRRGNEDLVRAFAT